MTTGLSWEASMRYLDSGSFLGVSWWSFRSHERSSLMDWSSFVIGRISLSLLILYTYKLLTTEWRCSPVTWTWVDGLQVTLTLVTLQVTILCDVSTKYQWNWSPWGLNGVADLPLYVDFNQRKKPVSTKKHVSRWPRSFAEYHSELWPLGTTDFSAGSYISHLLARVSKRLYLYLFNTWCEHTFGLLERLSLWLKYLESM